jgi:hypothetical protein
MGWYFVNTCTGMTLHQIGTLSMILVQLTRASYYTYVHMYRNGLRNCPAGQANMYFIHASATYLSHMNSHRRHIVVRSPCFSSTVPLILPSQVNALGCFFWHPPRGYGLVLYPGFCRSNKIWVTTAHALFSLRKGMTRDPLVTVIGLAQ